MYRDAIGSVQILCSSQEIELGVDFPMYIFKWFCAANEVSDQVGGATDCWRKIANFHRGLEGAPQQRAGSRQMPHPGNGHTSEMHKGPCFESIQATLFHQ